MEENVIDSQGVRDRATEILKRVVAHSFETMIGLTAEVGEVYADRPTSASGRSVAGFIGWGGNWNGTGILSARRSSPAGSPISCSAPNSPPSTRRRSTPSPR